MWSGKDKAWLEIKQWKPGARLLNRQVKFVIEYDSTCRFAFYFRENARNAARNDVYNNNSIFSWVIFLNYWPKKKKVSSKIFVLNPLPFS